MRGLVFFLASVSVRWSDATNEDRGSIKDAYNVSDANDIYTPEIDKTTARKLHSSSSGFQGYNIRVHSFLTSFLHTPLHWPLSPCTRFVRYFRVGETQQICSQQPSCYDYGGDQLEWNGTHWFCSCAFGYDSGGCQLGLTDAPTVSTTLVPTQSPTVANAWLNNLDNLQKVTASDGSSDDRFGYSVALSGSHLVVGAYGDDSYQGSVYLYSVSDSGVTFVQKVTANDGSSYDRFGYSVALSGTHLVVGAYGDDSYQGSVYVYSVSDSGVTFVQKVTANDGHSHDNFGYGVALSGTHLVVGAEIPYEGSVYVYSVSDLGATLVQKVTVNDSISGDQFGESVALSSTHLVVGAYCDGDRGSCSGSVYLA